jgi:hypothetical protein
MPLIERTSSPLKQNLFSDISGIPPPTVPSKRRREPVERATSFSSVYARAIGALLAVTTSIPLESAVLMLVRAGSPDGRLVGVSSTSRSTFRSSRSPSALPSTKLGDLLRSSPSSSAVIPSGL